MNDPGWRVVQLVGGDLPETHGHALRTLLAQPFGRPSALVLVGGGRLPAQLGAPLIHLWTGIPGLVSWRARGAIERIERAEPSATTILHVWSPRALPAARARCGGPIVIEFEAVQAASGRLRSKWLGDRAAWIVTGAVLRECALRSGVPPEHCVLIKRSADVDALSSADRAEARRALGLADHEILVTPSLPLTSRTGGLLAIWSALLVAQIRPEIRLLIPGSNWEAERARRLVISAGQARVLCRPQRDPSLADALVASDVVMHLPAGDAPVDGLIWAMAAGRPIVATAVPAVRELLVHLQTARLCRPNDPHAAAARLLETIEDVDRTRELAAAARELARAASGADAMIASYRRVYENLALGRRPGEGVA
jgi:glycosyltransferase involved in cell wall biosynthesis